MKITSVFILVFLFSVLILVGCSSNKSNPVIPVDNDNGLDVPLVQPYETPSEHQLLGVFNVTFDIEALEAFIEPDRTLNAHYNVTAMIPSPAIQVNSWDPVEEVVDVDVTLHNPFLFDAYDVRLIIYADDAGHLLLNPDDWTHLFDIPGGLWSNPFRAYAKYETSRKFGGTSYHQENLQIKCPGSNFTVQFAVDASHPDNCEEPYEISNFSQDVIYDQVGSSGWIYVDVFDWQNDVSEVKIDCMSITGANDIPFTYDSGNTWKLELVNNNGAPPGEYGAILFTKSTGSGSLELFERVKVKVSSSESPYNPVNVGEFRTPLPYCVDVYIHNGYLFALDKHTGLYALDISNPYQTEIISNLPLYLSSDQDDYFSLDCSGNYALAGFSIDNGDYTKYYIVDISDPFNMQVVSRLEFNYEIYGMSYDGNYAVYGIGSELKVIDMSTPSVPFIAGELVINSEYPVIRDNLVYAFTKQHPVSVSIVDISDPGNPVVISEYYPFGRNSCSTEKPVALDGDILCVASSSYGYPATDSSHVETVNISDPYHPVKLDHVTFTGTDMEWNGDTIRGMTTSDGYIVFNRIYNRNSYYPGLFRTYLLDISNPSNIIEKDYIQESSTRGFNRGAISGNICYSDEFGVGVIDYSDPDNLIHESAFQRLLPGILGISETGLAYVAGSYNHLCVFDLSDMQNPQFLSDFDLGNYLAKDFVLFNNYIILALREDADHPISGGKIQVLDISDPFSLSEINVVDVDFNIVDLFYDTGYLYIAIEDGLLIYNVSNPQVVDLVGSLEIEYFRKLFSKDDYIYGLTMQSSGKLLIIDISDPSTPLIVNEIEAYRPRDLEIKDNVLYLLNDDYVTIYDISSPTDPMEISGFESSYNCRHLAVSGNYIYLSGAGEIWDITDLQNPQYISQLDVPYPICDSEIIDNYAISNCTMFGLQVNKLW
jgi:hypothetical protein